MTGIYQIKSATSGKSYIGSAVNIEKRWRVHKKSLGNNKHHSSYLQEHFNELGIEDLEFTVLEICEKDNLIKREQHYIDCLNSEFNMAKIANSSLGLKRRPETIEKIKLANLGLKHPDWRNKIKSLAQGGENHWTKFKEIPFSKESRLKMSESQKKLYENGYKHPNRKSIIQYDLEDSFIKDWESIAEAQREYGKSITHSLKNETKTAYGYKWKYKEYK